MISEPGGQGVFSQKRLHSHVEPTTAGVKELLSLGEHVKMHFVSLSFSEAVTSLILLKGKSVTASPCPTLFGMLTS